MTTATSNATTKAIVEPLLCDPVTGDSLTPASEGGYQSPSGEKFPVIDNVLCLIRESDRGDDLGDKKFYEENPFGVRDWSNPAEVDAGVEKEIKDFLKDVPKDALIADVGCGSGRVSNYLSMNGFTNVVSIDYSLNSVRMVQQNSNNYCIWGNNLELPFKDGAFDYVISTGVIHHTPDPHKAFAECARIIKPGGRFFVKMRNVHSLYGYTFMTYGAVMRASEKSKAFRWVSEIFGFGVYKLVRKVFYSHLPKRPNDELRGKYENLYIKDLITFFTTPQVKKMIDTNGLDILYGHKTQATHRQHFYVCQKRG